MKKLLLLSALAVATLGASAQTITVTVEGEPIKNGDVVNSSRIVEIEDEYQGVVYYDYQLEPEMFVSSDTDVKCNITVTNTSAVMTPVGLDFCWPMGCEGVPFGESVIHTGTVSSTPRNLGIESPLMSSDELPTEPFTISCTVEIVPTENPSAKFSYSLNLAYDPQNVGGVEGIVDDFNAPVEYYDLMGRKVLNPAKGQIVIERKGSKAIKVVK